MSRANIQLWGMDVAVVEWDAQRGFGRMEYRTDFADFANSAAIEVSPIYLPVQAGAIYQFPELAKTSFKGLPGMLADSLPDRFGHAMIDHWVTQRRMDPNDFSPVDRLCYIGQRGMGALEYTPSEGREASPNDIHLDDLVRMCNYMLSERERQEVQYDAGDLEQTVSDMIMIGSSAGGAKAKAVIAWNPDTNSIKSGQVDAGDGYEHWLIKFDGITAEGTRANANNDCRMEYAYYLLAQKAGLTMSECRLLEEGEHAHFMTKRFDRLAGGEKLHMQTLAGVAHMLPSDIKANSYERAMFTASKLGLTNRDKQQLYRQAAFNAYFKNHDDHTKNISFCMSKNGEWTLSPAYDLTYHYFEGAVHQSQHAMSINGESKRVTKDNLLGLAYYGDIKASTANRILDEVISAGKHWESLAAEAGVPAAAAEYVTFSHGLDGINRVI